MTKPQKLTKLISQKGYPVRIIWVVPNGMGWYQRLYHRKEGPSLDIPGHSRWFGYSYQQALDILVLNLELLYSYSKQVSTDLSVLWPNSNTHTPC